MCPRDGLDDLEKRKIPCRYRDLNPASFSRDNAVTVITTLTVTTTLTNNYANCNDYADYNNYAITARVLRCKKFNVRNTTCSRKVYYDQL